MTLQASLETRLDAGSVVQKLVGAIAGPSGALHAIDTGVSPDRMSGATDGASQVDVSGIGAAVGRVAQGIEPLIAQLPGAGDTIAPLLAGGELVEQAVQGDLPGRFEALLGRVRAEMDGSAEGGFPGVLLRVAAALGSAPEGLALAALAKALLGAVGAPASTASLLQPIGDALPALDGSTKMLAGLMSLETLLSEAERLTGVMAKQLVPSALEKDLAAAEASFGEGAGSLATFLATVAPDRPADAQAAEAAVTACVTRVNALAEQLAASMGLGEAILVAVDPDQLLADVATATAMVRGADMAPTGRVVAAGVERVRPLLPADLSGIAGVSFDALIAEAHDKVSELAAGIDAIDIAGAVQPVSDGIGLCTSAIGKVADVLEGVTQAVRTALAKVRDVIHALPFDDVVHAIQTVLAPITTVLDFIKNLIAEVKAAIEAAAAAVTDVLGKIEGAVDGFKAEIDAFFGVAEKFVQDLHLEQVIGAVGDQVKAFSAVLAQAQMKPYFDTAIDAIGTTADVVSAIPFGMLPDSMKQQVDDAVKPIKDTDAAAVEAEIESLLAITEDGHFAVRAELEAAIAEIGAQFQALVDAMAEHDPRRYLAQIDAQLATVADKIKAIAPEITLQPVRDAIDKVKAAVASVDLDRELQPIRDVVQRIVGAIDEYSPAKLLQPVADRVNEARTKLVGLVHLDRWAPAVNDLRERAQKLLGFLDPAQLADQLGAVFADVEQLLGAVDDDALSMLGNVVCTLLAGTRLRLYPRSFRPVAGWLRDGSSGNAALVGRTRRVADQIAATTAAVQAIDPAAFSARLAPRAQALKAAVAALPASDLATRLQGIVAHLEPEAAFAQAAVNRDRYVARLGAAAGQVETLRRVGFSEVDVGVEKVRDAWAPASVFSSLLLQLLDRLGVPGLDRGLAGVVHRIFQKVTPARLIGIVTPLVTALHGRIQVLLDAVLTPVQAGIAEIQRAVAAIDLGPTMAAIQGVVDEVKAQIQALSPDVLLAAPLGSFKALQAEVAAFDPLAPLLHVLDALKETIPRIIGKLSAESLLATPLRIFDEIVAALRQVSPEGLLDPLLDELDDLARQVDEGLDGTVTAFERLQQALPGGGGGSSATASVSVG